MYGQVHNHPIRMTSLCVILQVQSLRSQLQEARDTVGTQRQEIDALKTKLEASGRDALQQRALLGETVHERKQQELNLQQVLARPVRHGNLTNLWLIQFIEKVFLECFYSVHLQQQKSDITSFVRDRDQS